MKECGVCKRSGEHLGISIVTVWCEPAKMKICKDCCIKNKGRKCPWWSICWEKDG